MNTAIVLMDVGDPKCWNYYDVDPDGNELYIRWLNHKMPQYKARGFKLIECNYISDYCHPSLRVHFDLKTTETRPFYKFIKKEQIQRIVFGGIHYGACTHNGRPLSAEYVQRKFSKLQVFTCPWLSLSHPTDYFKEFPSATKEFPQIYL